MMLITIICIGKGLNPAGRDEKYVKRLNDLGWRHPQRELISADLTFCYAKYIMDCNHDPLNVSEYASRLAATKSTFVMQLDDVENVNPFKKSSWKQLLLKERPGRRTHIYAK